ncbi:MAG: hypothetical protein ACM3ZE_03510 [Myxococcales bacterium]
MILLHRRAWIAGKPGGCGSFFQHSMLIAVQGLSVGLASAAAEGIGCIRASHGH